MQKNIELLKIQLNASRMQAYTPALVFNYAFQPIVGDEETVYDVLAEYHKNINK